MDVREEVVVEFATKRLKWVSEAMKKEVNKDTDDHFAGYYQLLGAMEVWIKELEEAIKELTELVK